MRAFLRALTSPVGPLWVVSHIALVLLGALFLAAAPLHKWLGQGVSEGIGGSLIAAGIAGVTLFLYVCTTEGLKYRLEAFTKAGLLKIFSGRSVLIRDEYHTRLVKAQHIDLIGFGLSAFREDYLNDFVGWSHRADVRILLIDPDFPTPRHSLADQRDKEENNPVGQIRSDVDAFEIAVSRLRSGDGARKATELTPGDLLCVASATEDAVRHPDRRVEVSRGRSRSCRRQG